MPSSKIITEIEAVVLAGGENRRFKGRVKASLLIDNKPIIEKTLDLFESLFTNITIITNNSAQFEKYSRFRMIPDIFLKVGPLGGIHAALNNTDLDAIFVIASDMPWVSKELVIKMVDRFSKSDCEVLLPRKDDFIEPLHAIYSKSVYQRLNKFLSTGSKYAIREFLVQTNVEYMDLENIQFDSRAFININTPDDYARFQSGTKNK